VFFFFFINLNLGLPDQQTEELEFNRFLSLKSYSAPR